MARKAPKHIGFAKPKEPRKTKAEKKAEAARAAKAGAALATNCGHSITYTRDEVEICSWCGARGVPRWRD